MKMIVKDKVSELTNILELFGIDDKDVKSVSLNQNINIPFSAYKDESILSINGDGWKLVRDVDTQRWRMVIM